MGSGVAFFDADGDGWQDILLINSKNWPGQPASPGSPASTSRHALYRNNHDGTFADITARSGLAVDQCRLGVAVADYDNDGLSDVFISGLNGNKLFRNAGGGRFTDVTAKAGVAAPGFSTSAAWLDYDRDGRVDLFVANYVDWSIATDLFCTLDGKAKSCCTPESYKGRSPVLFHNKGDGTFDDVTKAAGLYDPASKALGVALIDYDRDGWTRSRRRQRHAAESSLSQPPRRHVHRRRHHGGHRVQRSGRRARRHGRRRRRLRTAPAARASSSATSRTR